MDLILSREDEKFIEDQVKAGRFASAEDVVGAALERLRHDDFTDFEPGELDELVAEGEADIKSGDVMTLDELRADLRSRSEAFRRGQSSQTG
jgi:putative addiction module CopG family antidote